jgi:AAA domain
MGILLAGACPFPTSCTPKNECSKQASSITPGASLKAARSSKSATASSSSAAAAAAAAAKSEAREARVLVCAPSNAAADELTLRLLQQGVIGADGNNFCKYCAA